MTVVVSIFAGYPLSVDGFVGKKFLYDLVCHYHVFRRRINSNLFVIKDLGMLNTIWAIILPGAVNVWNIILARTYFKAIPKELKEAAKVDGASDVLISLRCFASIKTNYFRISFICIRWTMEFLFRCDDLFEDANLHPLQLVLRSILIQNQVDPGMIADQLAMAELKRLSEMIKYSSIVISSLPLIVMYPFFQKYFEKGVMVGSLK